jgi:hypothetical protein
LHASRKPLFVLPSRQERTKSCASLWLVSATHPCLVLSARAVKSPQPHFPWLHRLSGRRLACPALHASSCSEDPCKDAAAKSQNNAARPAVHATVVSITVLCPAAVAPPGAGFCANAPEQRSCERESMQTMMFLASLSEAAMLSKGVTLDSVMQCWQEVCAICGAAAACRHASACTRGQHGSASPQHAGCLAHCLQAAYLI